jgi:hypothetical protein
MHRINEVGRGISPEEIDDPGTARRDIKRATIDIGSEEVHRQRAGGFGCHVGEDPVEVMGRHPQRRDAADTTGFGESNGKPRGRHRAHRRIGIRHPTSSVYVVRSTSPGWHCRSAMVVARLTGKPPS